MSMFTTFPPPLRIGDPDDDGLPMPEDSLPYDAEQLKVEKLLAQL